MRGKGQDPFFFFFHFEHPVIPVPFIDKTIFSLVSYLGIFAKNSTDYVYMLVYFCTHRAHCLKQGATYQSRTPE